MSFCTQFEKYLQLEKKMEKTNKDYVIFTDTDTDMTPSVAKEYGYNLISMPYKIGEQEVFPYVDFDNFEAHTFYDELRHGKTPTTFGLSPKAYEDYFEPFFKAGKDILYVHLSRAMSGTFNSMSVAIENLKAKYPDRTLYTVDTKAITIGSYNIVREVGQMYVDGKTIQEILDWAKEEVDKFATYLFVNDLSFFRRSGRVKSVAAIMGNIFGIRPIINMDSDGLMNPIGKARGLNGAITKIMEIVDELQDDITKHRVIIGHSDCLDTAKMLGDKLQAKYGKDLEIEYVEVNPTAGSHCGPDGVGVCFHAKHR